MLVKILLGVAVLVVIFLAIAATRPAAYHVERKLEIAAPVDAVFAVFNDLHQFAGLLFLFGSPLESDPGMQKTFEGQSFAWSGKDAGTGKLTLKESVPGQKVGLELEFVKPMESKAAVTLAVAPAPAGSVVTWSMDGNHNFLGKAMSMFMNMDNAIGGDIEKGLAQLETVVEGAKKQPVH